MNSCEALNLRRRATALIEVWGASLSATMVAFSASDHVRRRPAPVNSSKRLTGST